MPVKHSLLPPLTGSQNAGIPDAHMAVLHRSRAGHKHLHAGDIPTPCEAHYPDAGFLLFLSSLRHPADTLHIKNQHIWLFFFTIQHISSSLKQKKTVKSEVLFLSLSGNCTGLFLSHIFQNSILFSYPENAIQPIVLYLSD